MTTVCLTFDFDALSLWIGTFGTTTPTALSRGEYAARVGIGRVLGLLRSHNIQATFFVPGHTADTYPEAIRAIMDAGHEIAGHAYLHESPVKLDEASEIEILKRSEEALFRHAGARPLGYRSPAWDLSPNTIRLLEDRGYAYDSSMMADDFRLYRPRVGDRVEENGTFVPGQESRLIEFPVAWELDDFVYFQFLGQKNPALRPTNQVYESWLDEFNYCFDHVQNGVFTLTCHPEVIGRGPRIAMLDRLIDEMKSREGTRFERMIDVACAPGARLT